MLDQNDIKKIGEIFEEGLKGTEKRMGDRFERLEGAEGRIIEAVGEMLEQNALPVIDALSGRLDNMQKTIANLPDKDYLDRKLADLDGNIVVREKKQDQK